MPNPQFPLAYRPRVGTTFKPQDTRVRTTNDAGPPKMRPRFTAAADEWQVELGPVKLTDCAVLDTFYATTLSQGTLPFDWRDRYGVAATFRFVTVIESTNVVPHSDPVKQRWMLRFTLERLP